MSNHNIVSLAALRRETAGNKTAVMTSREIGNHLASQQSKGWPGSYSISGRPIQRASSKQ